MPGTPERPPSPSSDIEDSPVQEADENGKRQMAEGSKVANRREKHLQGARELLVTWRSSVWLAKYRRRPWGIQGLLPDTVVTSIATKARLKTIEDLEGTGWSSTHAKRHGEEVLKMLDEYDAEFYEAREAEKRENAEKRKAETKVRQQAKKAEQKAKATEERIARAADRALERATVRANQPPKPRPSRAKKAPRVVLNEVHSLSAGPSTPHPTTPYRGRENMPPSSMYTPPIFAQHLHHSHRLPYHSPTPFALPFATPLHDHTAQTNVQSPQHFLSPYSAYRSSRISQNHQAQATPISCVTPSSFYAGSCPSPFLPAPLFDSSTIPSHQTPNTNPFHNSHPTSFRSPPH